MSKALKCRPSDVLGLTEPIERYAFDSAVVLWGSAFDAAVEGAARDAKTQQEAENKINGVVRRWLPKQRQYASPSRR